MMDTRKMSKWLLGVLCGYLLFEAIKEYGPTLLEKAKILDWFSFAMGLLILVVPILTSHLIHALISAWQNVNSNTPNAHFEEVVSKKLELSDQKVARLQNLVSFNERAHLESRLNVLWNLSEFWKTFKESHEDWEVSVSDDEDVTWVEKYAYREIRRIGKRLRELDQERIENEKRPLE